MNNELATIDPKRFENLPTLVKTAQERVQRAILATEQTLKQLDALDIKTATADIYEVEVTKAAALRAKLATTLSAITGEREPYTRFFDEIRSLFTGEEAKVKALIDSIKTRQNAWESEKHARNKAEKDKADAIIAERQRELDNQAAYLLTFNRRYLETRSKNVEKLHATFNGKQSSELEAYGETLKKWEPSAEAWFSTLVMGIPQGIITDGKRAEVCDDYRAFMNEEKIKLIDSIPARLKMSAEALAKQLEKDKADRDLMAKVDDIQLTEAIAADLEGKKVDAVLDVPAAPLIAAGKGSSKKKKYVVEKMADINSILQYYVRNELPNLTVEEATKKFGFAITFANKCLNAGETITGIKTEEEFVTRTNSVK